MPAATITHVDAEVAIFWVVFLDRGRSNEDIRAAACWQQQRKHQKWKWLSAAPLKPESGRWSGAVEWTDAPLARSPPMPSPHPPRLSSSALRYEPVGITVIKLEGLGGRWTCLPVQLKTKRKWVWPYAAEGSPWPTDPRQTDRPPVHCCCCCCCGLLQRAAATK